MSTRLNGRRVRRQDLPEPTRFGVQPPWLGYCPDLNASFTSFTAFSDSQGLVSQDGQLTLDLGWIRLENSLNPTLPLGGYLDAGGNHSWVNADAGYEQPVILLAELSRSDVDDEKLNLLAATALSMVAIPFGNPPDGTATVGYCWWLDPGNLNWTEVPWNAAGGGTQITNATRSTQFDWAFYARGGTAIANNTIPGEIYFCNYVDEVYYWDIGSAAGPPGEYFSAFGTPFGTTPFYAKSVDAFVDRLVFLNTREEIAGPALARQPKRVRWTDLGSPPSLTAAGAGFIDFDEFIGDGLRVLSFQNRVACYFQDGVGVLERTNTSTYPFRRDYWSKERGLIGTFAVVRIDKDRHFGIFTDGWFFLSANGQWTEAGTVSTGMGLIRKWTRTFFSLLDSTRKDDVVVNFDKFTNRIQICFPLAGGGQEEEATEFATWVYDMKTDTVWPDDPYTVDCWGEASALWGDLVPWLPDMGGITWQDVEGVWSDYGIHYGERATVHGTEYGLVLLHTPLLTTRDEADVEWWLRSHLQYLDDAGTEKVADGITLEYGTQVNSHTITAGFRNDNGGLSSENIDVASGSGGTRSSSVVHPSVSGYSIGTVFAGVGAIRLWNWFLEFRPTETPLKEV